MTVTLPAAVPAVDVVDAPATVAVTVATSAMTVVLQPVTVNVGLTAIEIAALSAQGPKGDPSA